MSKSEPDDRVGAPEARLPGEQLPEQAAVLGGGGEGGSPEPKSPEDWAERGAAAGVPGRPPVALGGSSAGQGDRMPAGGPGQANAPASNPATKPGKRHEA